MLTVSKPTESEVLVLPADRWRPSESRFGVLFLVIALSGLVGGCVHRLRVEPPNVTISPGETVAFVAAVEDRKTTAVRTQRVIWKARDVTKDRTVTISQQGTFTASSPGIYRIIAASGKYRADATVRVRDGLVRDPNEKPLQITKVSSLASLGSEPPALRQPAISGPGWPDSIFRQVFHAENRFGRGLHPRSQKTSAAAKRVAARAVDAGAGFGNYSLTVPVLNLPGRKLNVSLNLYYNSQLWLISELYQSTYLPLMIFDPTHEWPAPGWSLGFGKAIRAGSTGVVLQDADGTVHPFAGVVNSYSASTEFVDHTTDGTLIDYSFVMNNSDGLYTGTVKYPNGMVVQYGAPSDQGNVMYPTQVVDANGNYVTITYRDNRGPEILAIQDTLGRTINFWYDANDLLTAITAPDVGRGTRRPRTVVRLHYSPMDLSNCKNLFPILLGPVSEAPTVCPTEAWKVDAIYFPSNSTGFWFGDADSYSPYYMIRKVSARRGMTFQSVSLLDQGLMTPGAVADEQVYEYSLTNIGRVNAIPTYTKMTETWVGMDVPPAVTTYSVTMNWAPMPRQLDIVYPDGSHVVQLMYNHPNIFDDGLKYSDATYDSAGNLLSKVQTTWELGDYDSPRIVAVQTTDQLNQNSSRTFSYDSTTQTNVLRETLLWGYDGSMVSRHHVDYESDSMYSRRHIFNLPKVVLVYTPQGRVASRTGYAYDQEVLANTPGIVGHSDDFNPYSGSYYISPDCSSTATGASCPNDYRGNVTQVTTYADAVKLAGAVTKSTRYDIAGNLVSTMKGCCEQLNIVYTSDTQFAYPSSISRGDPNPASPTRLTETFTYDFSTGLQLSTTDVIGRLSTMEYESWSLRPLKLTLPSRALITYTYDDINGSLTKSAFYACPLVSGHPYPCKHQTLAAQHVKYFNGLGLVQAEQNLMESGPSVVETEYDALGRLWRRSQPLFPLTTPDWNEISYDALGRVTSMRKANGGEFKAFYDEASRPSSASSLPGETVRLQDGVGRERWFRLDALKQLVEVVEPNAYQVGSNTVPGGVLSLPGNTATTYSYNELGRITKVIQGPNGQESDFQFDSLGRLVAEYLPAKSRTLDDSGRYVGTATGKWSDIFVYDDRSNLVSRTDARGVKVAYDYGTDPLDRLQNVFYGPSYDPASPVIPVAPITYHYMTTGDLRRVSSIGMQRGSDDSWGLHSFVYDSQGRLSSKQVRMNTSRDWKVAQFDYGYDDFDRVTTITYPSEYGTAAGGRKNVTYSLGVGGWLKDLQIDGVEFASQISHNVAGQLSSMLVGSAALPGWTIETYNYDGQTGFLHDQQVQLGATSSFELSLTYDYYQDGRLSQVTDALDSGRSRKYGYDGLGRILDAVGGTGTATSWTEYYNFDSYGNRLSVSASGQAPNGSPIPLDGLAGNPVPPNGLAALTYDTQSNHISISGFSYDAAGNLIRGQRRDGSWVKFQYDAVGRLALVSDDAGNVLEASIYGVDGHRMIQFAGLYAGVPTYFVWNGNHLLAEFTQAAGAGSPLTWTRSRVYLGDRILATIVPTTSGELAYYHHPDRLGVALVTNNADTTVRLQQTLPFGTLMPGGSSNPLNPIFSDYMRSFATGLDYAPHREYDPDERFIEADPTGFAAINVMSPQTLNLYAYVDGDPLNVTDLTGLQGGGVCQSYDPNDPTGTACTDGGGSGGGGFGALLAWIAKAFSYGFDVVVQALAGAGNYLIDVFSSQSSVTKGTPTPPALPWGGSPGGIGAAAVAPGVAGINFQNLLTTAFRLTENADKLFTSVANTVPDLYVQGEALGEVKFVQSLYQTDQLAAQFEVAVTEDIPYYIFVAPETEVASTVFSAVEATGGRVVAFDAMTGTLSDAATGLELAADQAWEIMELFTAKTLSTFIVNAPLTLQFPGDPTPGSIY